MKNAILFIGLPGSGKSTYINKNIDESKYMIVDADKLKETHPDYDSKDPQKVHQWSVKEAEREINVLSDLGYNICMDSGGINNSYQLRIINMLKSKGYHIELIHMDTPLDVCLKRNKLRDRRVPENAIIEKSTKLESCLEKQLPLVNKFTHVKYNWL